MIELLLSAQLTCADAYWILDGIENSENMSQVIKSDLKMSVIESMPDNCNRNDHEIRPRNR